MKKILFVLAVAAVLAIITLILSGCETRKFDSARFAARNWQQVASFDQVDPDKVEAGETVKFVRPLRGTFKVVWVDLHYQNALVTTEDRKKAYLLTRLTRLPEWRKRNLSIIAHDQGYR